VPQGIQEKEQQPVQQEIAAHDQPQELRIGQHRSPEQDADDGQEYVSVHGNHCPHHSLSCGLFVREYPNENKKKAANNGLFQFLSNTERCLNF